MVCKALEERLEQFKRIGGSANPLALPFVSAQPSVISVETVSGFVFFPPL